MQTLYDQFKRIESDLDSLIAQLTAARNCLKPKQADLPFKENGHAPKSLADIHRRRPKQTEPEPSYIDNDELI